MVVLAGMATIIASQALISGIFSLTRQAIQMGFCPLARIVPTSSEEAGQVYVPIANWLLMVATLLIVVLFKTSANLAAAYGIAVSATMLITTILLYRVMVTWWPRAIVVPIIMAFAVVDAVFLASNSLKIVDGGWIPIVIGALVAIVMLSWHRGSSVVRRQLTDMSMPLAKFVDNIDEMVVARVAGTGVWLTKVASHQAQSGRASSRRAPDSRARSKAARAVPRAPCRAQPRQRLLSYPGTPWLHADACSPAHARELPTARLRCRYRACSLLCRPRNGCTPGRGLRDGTNRICSLCVSNPQRQPCARLLPHSACGCIRGGIPA
jgi:hypothetical protein